jgi:uncharacterized protein (TIGR01568 family)
LHRVGVDPNPSTSLRGDADCPVGDDADLRAPPWLVQSGPVVLYSHQPCKDFYASMSEMVIRSKVLVNLHDLLDMFCWFLLHNSPDNHHHVEEAFTDLLTNLWD